MWEREFSYYIQELQQNCEHTLHFMSVQKKFGKSNFCNEVADIFLSHIGEFLLFYQVHLTEDITTLITSRCLETLPLN